MAPDLWEQPEGAPHLRLFTRLIRPFFERVGRSGVDLEPGTKDNEASEDLSERAKIVSMRASAAMTEAQWLVVERRSLRRLAVDLQQFERRHHLMLIDPPWSTWPLPVDANAVFFSGSNSVQTMLDEVCERIGMWAPAWLGVDHPAHARWQRLRQSAVAVLDFSQYDRAQSDPVEPMPWSQERESSVLRAAGPVAAVAFETGWALVLGKPIVIVARRGQEVPFDIPVEAVRLDGDRMDTDRLAEGVRAAIYGEQRGLGGDGLPSTVAELRSRCGTPESLALLDSLSGWRDAIRAQLTAAVALEHASLHNTLLTLPAFPAAYAPHAAGRALFHVTAFRDWSQPCQQVTREACARAGLEYRIGYERLEPNILGAVWSDLCQASFVVADMTNLNPNAALELAIAQALGRPTLILTRNAELPKYLPSLQKFRIHRYEADDAGRRELGQLLDRFLSEGERSDRPAGGPVTDNVDGHG